MMKYALMIAAMAAVVCGVQFESPPPPPLNATVLPNTTAVHNGTLFPHNDGTLFPHNDGTHGTFDRMWILINNYELTEVIAIAACVMIITHSMALIAVTFKISCFIERMECCYPNRNES